MKINSLQMHKLLNCYKQLEGFDTVMQSLVGPQNNLERARFADLKSTNFIQIQNLLPNYWYSEVAEINHMDLYDLSVHIDL